MPKSGSATTAVDDIVGDLVTQVLRSLGPAVVGIYLYGSAVAGDFDRDVSDIDILIATGGDLDDAQLGALVLMHDRFELEHAEWAGRVDASYLSLAALSSPEQSGSPIVVISPGESLGRKRTSEGWRMNWHQVRAHGLALVGPPARSVIAETTNADFLAAVRVHMDEMPERTAASSLPQFHAYAVLTGCRALFTWREEEQASKRQAAEWARAVHPQWSDLIRASERVRKHGPSGPRDELRDEAVLFLRFVRSAIAGQPGG
jgi:predicted nucleotidyltransferase